MKNKQRASKIKPVSTADLDGMHDVGVDLSSHMDHAKTSGPDGPSSV